MTTPKEDKEIGHEVPYKANDSGQNPKKLSKEIDRLVQCNRMIQQKK